MTRSIASPKCVISMYLVLVLNLVVSLALHGWLGESGKKPASSDPVPHLHFVISDRVGFDESFLVAMGDQAVTLLSEIGIRATWSGANSTSAEAESEFWRPAAADSYLVTLTARPPSAWGVKARAMGMFVPRWALGRRVIIFPERIFHVLGGRQRANCRGGTRCHHRTTRAFARILVHELVHAIVPEHSHSQDGLLRGTLDRRLLLAQDLPLGVECVAAVRESLGGSRRTAYTLHHGLL